MMNGLDDILKQVQEAQQKMADEQKKAQEREEVGQSGAGLVSVTMTGKYDVKRVAIDESLLSENFPTEDREVLEDLIAAAVNDAVRRVEKNQPNTMGGMADQFENLKDMMPPGFKFPF